MTTEFEKTYQRLFYLRGADTKHMNDCELVWRSRDAEIARLQAQVDALTKAGEQAVDWMRTRGIASTVNGAMRKDID